MPKDLNIMQKGVDIRSLSRQYECDTQKNDDSGGRTENVRNGNSTEKSTLKRVGHG